MTKIDLYRIALKSMLDWDEYLLEHSGLPEPRANLELAQAVAQEGDVTLFRRYLALDPERAPTNTPHVFLVVCGALGLGRLLSEGNREVLPELRCLASDPRWRIREAVAMALQAWGDADLSELLAAMRLWSPGNPLEQRAAAAALAEPRLLRQVGQVLEVLDILDSITLSVESRATARAKSSESCARDSAIAGASSSPPCPTRAHATGALVSERGPGRLVDHARESHEEAPVPPRSGLGPPSTGCAGRGLSRRLVHPGNARAGGMDPIPSAAASVTSGSATRPGAAKSPD
ncbi:MAG TPA: HEAT repeat domain-containing protein [Anaerolineae bacterium]|nr:HEAT repeat domain-containing protein [Anaerolineae bacterium]